MTQIEIIVDSIKELIDPKDLETIRHFYFAPWNREIPYKITISSQPKEETTILHNLYLKTLYNNSSVLSIYTDGSQTQKGIGIGLGLVVYSHETPYIPVVAKHRESRNIGASAIVYNRELEGVTRAIEYASSKAKRGELFNIYTDNQAGLLRLKTPSDKPGQSQQIRAILATKALIAKGASIELI
jgi:ribonuclease HI